MDEETTRLDEYLTTNVVSRMVPPFPRANRQTRRFCKPDEAFATELDVSVAMAKGSGSADVDPSAFMSKGAIEKTTGFNSGLIVLIVVVGALLIFGVGNYFLYQYAQKNLPPKKKKPVSKKKLKKEKLKGGVRPAGD